MPHVLVLGACGFLEGCDRDPVSFERSEEPAPAQRQETDQRQETENEELPWFHGEWKGNVSLQEMAPLDNGLRWGKRDEAPAVAGAASWDVEIRFAVDPEGRISGEMKAAQSVALNGVIDGERARVTIRGPRNNGVLVLHADDEEELSGVVRVSSVEEEKGRARHRAFVGAIRARKVM